MANAVEQAKARIREFLKRRAKATDGDLLASLNVGPGAWVSLRVDDIRALVSEPEPVDAEPIPMLVPGLMEFDSDARLRDEFATQAMSEMDWRLDRDSAARACYSIADAMLKARKEAN